MEGKGKQQNVNCHSQMLQIAPAVSTLQNTNWGSVSSIMHWVCQKLEASLKLGQLAGETLGYQLFY